MIWRAARPAWYYPLIFMVMVAAVLSGNAARAFAMDPATLYNVAPKYIADEIGNKCNVAGWNVVQLQWISPVGQPTATQMSVESGSTVITLQQNWITYRCKAGTSNVVSGSAIIDKVTANNASVTVQNLQGTIVDMPYVATNTTGHRTGVTKNFTVTGSFNSQQSITLTEASRGTITRSNGADYCAQVGSEGNKPTTGPHDFDPEAYPGFCYSENTTMTLLVRVHVTVSGRLFVHDTGVGAAGIGIDTCGNGTTTTNGTGNYAVAVNKGSSFCVRAVSGIPAGAVGPRARPMVAGYPGQTPDCPAFSTSTTSPMVNGENYCVQSSYECQVAGGTVSSAGCTSVNFDRNRDDGYDMVFTALPPPPPPPPPTDKPYFEARGGDIVAGSSFAHEKTDGTMVPCSSSEAAHNTNAGIVGQIRQPDYAGAGGEYAAFAWNRIQDFRTSKANASGPAALSFANKNPEAQVNVSAGRFGGMFASAPCVDYWSEKPTLSGLPTISGNLASPAQIGGLTGSYYSNGDLVLAGNNRIQDGKRLTIYVNGNVSIRNGSGNNGIVYDKTEWGNYKTIPTFRLIVKGSIFIDAGIENLDGQYVAVPVQGYTTAANSFAAPLPGTISTCANGFTTYRPADAAAGMINTCGRQLRVQGSFAANQVWLLRTAGTVGSGVVAEVFQYGPESWLVSPVQGTFDPEYDSIIGLPPIL